MSALMSGTEIAESPGLLLPFYVRVLRLHTLRPATWQRALFFEGTIVVSVLVVLADLASAWLLVVLPTIVAVAVKFTDMIATELRTRARIDAFEVSGVIARDARVADRAA